MANTEIKTKILLRNDTAANWSSVNPILGKGEIGIEIDTYKLKIGDGVLSWSSLEYFGGEQLDVDGTSIVLNDGKLMLAGIESAGSGYTLVSDGKGGVTWAKPSETTVEGLSSLITALDERVSTVEEDVESLSGTVSTLQSTVDNKANKSDLDAYLSIKQAEQTYALKESVENKADKTTVEGISTRITNIESAYVKSINYTPDTGVFTIVKEDGSSTSIDLAIEKVVTNFVYDESNKSLVLTLADGTTQTVPMTAFIDDYKGSTGDEVIVEISGDNVISAVLSNSVKENINKGVQALSAVESLSSEVDNAKSDIVNIQKEITSINSKIDTNISAIEALGSKVSDVKDANGNSLKNAETNEVTLPIATASALGLVRSSAEENSVSINADGKMYVHSLNVNKLSQTEGEELILNGGSAGANA